VPFDLSSTLSGDAVWKEFRIQMEGLQRSIRSGRKRSFWLVNATITAVILAGLCSAAHYAATVLTFARVDRQIRIRRYASDPDQLILDYRPLTGGTIGFRRADGNRETELVDWVMADAIGKQQSFAWRVQNVRTGDPIKVTCLDGWSMSTRQVRVPKPTSGSPIGIGILAGQIVSQLTGKPVQEATVRIPGP